MSHTEKYIYDTIKWYGLISQWDLEKYCEGRGAVYGYIETVEDINRLIMNGYIKRITIEGIGNGEEFGRTFFCLKGMDLAIKIGA